jgi:TetR/AcrR family transcriptional regulator, transcriptional repressor for nem operon
VFLYLCIKFPEAVLSKSERTREFIIATTAEIFNTKGYAGTSLSDMTEATGLTKGSIYGNFENKEEVALAVFDYNLSQVVKRIEQQMADAPTWHDKLLVYCKIYRDFGKHGFLPGGCPILNTATEADDTNPLLKDRAAKAVLRWKKRVEDLIGNGIAAGELKEDTDAKQVALSIIALIEGGMMIAKVTGQHAHLNTVLKTVETLIYQLKR